MDRHEAIHVITGAGYGADLDRLLALLAEMPPRTALVLDHLLDVVLFEEPAGAVVQSQSTAAATAADTGRQTRSD